MKGVEPGPLQPKANTAVLAVGQRKDNLLRKILAVVPGNLVLRKPQEVLPAKFLCLGMLGGALLSRVAARVGGIGASAMRGRRGAAGW